MMKKRNTVLWAAGIAGVLSFAGCNVADLQDTGNNNQGNTSNVSVSVATSAECMELAKRVLYTSEDNGQELKETFLKECVTFFEDSSTTGADGDSANLLNDNHVSVAPDITCDWIEEHIEAREDSLEGGEGLHPTIESVWCEDEGDVGIPEPAICSDINIELDSNKAYIHAIFYDECWTDSLPFPLPPIDCEGDSEIMDCGWIPEPDPYTLEGAEKYTGYVPDDYDGAVCMALLPDCMTKSEWIQYLKSEILKDPNPYTLEGAEKYTGYVPDEYNGAVCEALLPECMTKSDWIGYLKSELLK